MGERGHSSRSDAFQVVDARRGEAASGEQCRHRLLLRVPRSNVAVEPVTVEANLVRRAVVRCWTCHRRAFDVIGVLVDTPRDADERFASLSVARRCVCHRTPEGQVTPKPGQPLPDGLIDAWRCKCGHFLARVDPVRGRLTVPCRRCGAELRATVADVIAAAEGAAHLA